jgi:hypothetical protein
MGEGEWGGKQAHESGLTAWCQPTLKGATEAK